MDGNSSICIDEVILKTNTARVQDMKLSNKPGIAQIESTSERQRYNSEQPHNEATLMMRQLNPIPSSFIAQFPRLVST